MAITTQEPERDLDQPSTAMDGRQLDEIRRAEGPRPRGRVLPLIVRGGLPIGILALGWIGYLMLSVEPEEAQRPPAKPRTIKTKVIRLRIQDYPTGIKTQGIVRPHHEITLNARVSGRITRISPRFEDGAFFSQGDLLVALDAEDYKVGVAVAEARLLGAKSALQLATLNHERNLEILKGNLISQAEVDQTFAILTRAEADVNSATARLKQARRDLERTRVLAPFDGRVRRRTVGLGQSVGVSTPLGILFATDYAEVRLPISESEMPFLNLPETAEDDLIDVELRDAINKNSAAVWRATIIRTEGVLDEGSLELFAISRVTDPFGRRSSHPPLRIGQPVIASIPGRVLSRVMALPRSAVRQLDQIYLVDETDLTLHAHTITPIWSDEAHVVIRDSNIAEGSLLATTHLVYAPDGAKVEILSEAGSVEATAVSGAASQTKPPRKVKS